MDHQDFPEANLTLVAPGCEDLRVQVDTNQVLSCWKMTWRERLSALFFGRVWLCIRGRPHNHPPVWILVERDPHERAPLPEPEPQPIEDDDEPADPLI